MYPKQQLPSGTAIQLEIRFIQNGELIEQGIIDVGESDESKEFRLAGLAAQRGVYEMLLKLWLHWEKD